MTSWLIITIIIILIQFVKCFEFFPPQVTCSDCTINVQTSYIFIIYRQLSTTIGVPTNWSTQLVPSGSNMTIRFPSQYTIYGNETCQYVLINSVIVSTYTCSINSTQKSVTISGAITSNQYISDVNVQINGVINPSPSGITVPFTATIGTDFSASNQQGSVTLLPGSFHSLSITFNPTTVNTTGSMIISATLGNAVPTNGSSIVITFPSTLLWTRELTSTHKLDLTAVTCSAITSNINTQIACTGDNSAGILTASNLFNSNSSVIPTNTSISFSINNLFSPPTNQTVDSITVQTHNGSNAIDISSAYITGLTPKNMSLSLSSASSLIINTQVPLTFSFALVDTIERANYFIISFPKGSTVNYITNTCFSCPIGLTNITYNSTSSQLTLYQASTSPARTNIGSFINLTIYSYTTPSSARTVGPFYLSVMSNSGFKIIGSNYITVLPKTYNATMTTTNTTINSIASYNISFNLSDPISSSGYFFIHIPADLSLSSNVTVTISSISLAINPTISISNVTGNSTINVTKINKTQSTIPTQSITIQITGLVQPGSVRSISKFDVLIYYSAQNDLISQASTTSTITTTPGNLISASVIPTSLVTANSNVIYTFSIVLGNGLNVGSTIQVTVPSTVGLNIGGTCQLQSANVSCTAANSTLKVSVPSAYSANTTINFSYSNFTNPPSTKPSATFNISTFNAASQIVDILPALSPFTVTMTTPSTLLTASITRPSTQNSQITVYTLLFTQYQIITEGTAMASMVFPNDITVSSSPNCTSGTASLTCSVSGNTVNIYFTTVSQINHAYNFSISGVKNPYSYKPSSSIAITTLSQDGIYQYSSISFGLQITNTIPSNFTQISYNFTSQSLNSPTNLIIKINSSVTFDYFLVLFADSFKVNASSSFTCLSDSFTPVCTLQLDNATSLYQLKVQSITIIPTFFNITISSLNSPAIIPTDYTKVSSYTSEGYKISEYTAIQFTTFCTFPCNTCLSIQKSACLSCYTVSLTNLIYLHNQTCVASCPDGYFQDTVAFTCKPCTVPCETCKGAANYCLTCDQNSTYIYLNKTNTTSTCLSECPVYMYPDLTQIPYLCVDCVSPCKKCSNVSTCITCVDNYFYYKSKCLTICPVSTTIIVNNDCIDCNLSCATCSVTVNNCTSCPNNTALLNHTCVEACPSNMIIISNVCTICDIKCLTCSILVTNCTSCNASTYPYLYENQCLQDKCPDFYYSNSFNVCLSCASLNMGCKNCSNPTICLSCDAGYVLLNTKCLSSVPEGYLNISGVAVPCQGDCATCYANLYNCTSCKTLSLYNNTCKQTCPTGYISLNRLCTACTYPCSQCINTTQTCLKCALNSSLYLLNSACVNASSCPAKTYPDNSTLSCANCNSPCSQCNSSTLCINCVAGYFYVNSTSTCELTCPPQSVGINRLCQACISPCLDCTNSTITCTSCINTYYFNPVKYQCSETCPNGTIGNQTTMQCMNCESPCKTCANTTDTCTSCINGTFLSNDLCLSKCPDGKFGQSGLCKACVNNCTTCSSATTCVSCSYPLSLYSGQCIDACPASHAINNNNTCIACTTVIQGCSNCSENGQCFECYSPKIYFQGNCLNSCPTGYIYIKHQCQINNSTTVLLEQSLKSNTFPVPFTILGCVVLIACCMSKLQNSNTYLIGLLYSLLGLVETGALAYLIYSYFSLGRQIYEWNNLLILFVVAGLIYSFNFLTMIIQTPYLLVDDRFINWTKHPNNKCFLTFVTVVSLLVNYKFRMILFSRLFKFYCTSAILQSISKFRIFNIFSFFGILVQALALYVCFISIFKFKNNLTIFYAFLDVIIIFLANSLLALFIAWKPEDFFCEQTDDGFSINKRIRNEGDDFSKQAILAENDFDELKYHGPDSYAVFKQENNSVIEEEDDKSDQLTGSDNHEEHKVNDSKMYKANIKVYFATPQLDSVFEGLSNQNDKTQSDQGEKKKKLNNIFSMPSQFEEYNGDHLKEQRSGQWDYSQPEGCEGGNFSKAPRSHKTQIVKASPNISSSAQKDEDVDRKIQECQLQLEQIKKQMEDTKSEGNQQVSYEELTIRDFSQKHKTNQSFTNDIEKKEGQEQRQGQLHQEEPLQIIGNTHESKQLQPPEHKVINHAELSHQDREDESVFKTEHSEEQSHAQKIQPPNIFEVEKRQLSEIKSKSESSHKFIEYEIANQFFEGEKAKQILQEEQKVPQIEQNNYNNENVQQKPRTNQNQERVISPKGKSNQNIFLQFQQNNRKFNEPEDEANNSEFQQNSQQPQNKNVQSSKQHPNNKNEIASKIYTEKLKSPQKGQRFKFEEESDSFERVNNMIKFEENKSNFEESLQESEHQNEKINERPYSGRRPSNINKNEELLKILNKAQENQIRITTKGGASHKIISQQEMSSQDKIFKHSGGPTREIQSSFKAPGETTKQQQSRLSRKQTINYPLGSNKNNNSQMRRDRVNSRAQSQRSKSINIVPGRKYISRDVSSGNLDELDMQQVNLNRNYEDLLNEREAQTQRKHIYIDNSNANYNFSGGRNQAYLRVNQMRDSDTYQDQELKRYYNKYINKNIEKKQPRKKNTSKEKSFQEMVRMKELQKIYAPPKH